MVSAAHFIPNREPIPLRRRWNTPLISNDMFLTSQFTNNVSRSPFDTAHYPLVADRLMDACEVLTVSIATMLELGATHRGVYLVSDTCFFHR